MKIWWVTSFWHRVTPPFFEKILAIPLSDQLSFYIRAIKLNVWLHFFYTALAFLWNFIRQNYFLKKLQVIFEPFFYECWKHNAPEKVHTNSDYTCLYLKGEVTKAIKLKVGHTFPILHLPFWAEFQRHYFFTKMLIKFFLSIILLQSIRHPQNCK